MYKAGDSTNTIDFGTKSSWFSKSINVFKICVGTKVTFCLTNCPLAPNSTTTTLPSHVVAKLKYKNTDEASRNTIIKKQIQHMKYRQQLVYGRKKVQSWLGLVASGPMEWGKRGKGWPEKATVRWSQLNVGGFFSWYESCHNSMWRRYTRCTSIICQVLKHYMVSLLKLSENGHCDKIAFVKDRTKRGRPFVFSA